MSSERSVGTVEFIPQPGSEPIRRRWAGGRPNDQRWTNANVFDNLILRDPGIDCTKYPASLDYVLMTIGPALVLLAWYDRLRFSSRNPLIVFGRVPLFYFILHFYAIHFLLGVVSYIRYGSRTFSFIFNAMPAMGGPRDVYPQNFGYPLWVTYAIWIGLVAALYPLCRWFGQYKATHQLWWLSYL